MHNYYYYTYLSLIILVYLQFESSALRIRHEPASFLSPDPTFKQRATYMDATSTLRVVVGQVKNPMFDVTQTSSKFRCSVDESTTCGATFRL